MARPENRMPKNRATVISFVLAALGVVWGLRSPAPAHAALMSEQLSGMILLQVEKNGEAWYVAPKTLTRFFLSRPLDAFNVMRRQSIGITNADLKKIPRAGTNDVGDASLQRRLSGYILLQVEAHGEAWYVYPKDLHRYSLGRPKDAFTVMRRLGLGISNSNLAQITKDPDSLDDTDPCGNAIGNGSTIVSGPSAPTAPQGGADYDQVFHSLTVDRTDPNRVFTGTERNGVLYSADGGVTWSRYRYGIRHIDSAGYTEIWNMDIAPSDRTKLLIAGNDSPGPLAGDYPSNTGGIYLSTTNGQKWSRRNCGLTNGQVASIVFDPANANIAYAGGRGGYPSFARPGDAVYKHYNSGIYRTTNAGATWKKVTLPGPGNAATNDFWQIVARGNPATYYSFGFNPDAFSENIGFVKSTDGVTWTAMASDYRTRYVTDFDVSTDGQVIIGSVRDASEFIISNDGGATWSSTILPSNGPVAISPADANRIVYTSHSDLRLSTDRLQTGTVVANPGAKVSDIVFAPSDPNIVYAMTVGYLLYKSTDAGASFTLLKNLRNDVLNVQP